MFYLHVCVWVSVYVYAKYEQVPEEASEPPKMGL